MCDDPLFYATGNASESMIWLEQYNGAVKVTREREIWLELPGRKPCYLTELQAKFLASALSKPKHAE